MNPTTKKKFTALKAAMAKTYGVGSVEEQFSISPSKEQTLQDKIVEKSTFLQKINVIPVDDMEGETILGSVSSGISGRTDTTVDGNERTPRNVLDLEANGYKLHKTNSDVAIRYNTLDAWAKFKDLAERYQNYVQAAIANDREIVGWRGESAAATTDKTTYPLMQDVNKGWMQQVRERKPSQILLKGAVEGEIRIGPGGDFENLDMAVNDILQGIPEHKRKDLVALIGSDLIARERSVLFKAVGGKPTEKNAMTTAMSTIGGLEWETPSNFPPRAIVITSYKNLSIYVQSGKWRRKIDDNEKKDQVEDYNSRNEGYVVEDLEKFAAVEFKNVKVPNAAGDGWV